MKTYYFWLILFISGCAGSENHAKKTSGLVNIIGEDTIPALQDVTTALSVKPLRRFPAGFSLDSTIVENGELNFFSRTYFPVSSEHGKFNSLVREVVKRMENSEKPTDQNRQDQTTFTLWLSGFKVSENLVQCLFIDQSFTEGAAHYNHGYKSVNYDLKKQQRIYFTDVVQFASNKEKQTFCDQFNEFSSQPIGPDLLTKDTDFQIKKDGIMLYFDDGEQSTSMSKIFIELKQIDKYLKMNYEL